MLERDPRKRRVKPVQKHLIQVDFGLSDSEGDSDYQLEENSGDSDEGSHDGNEMDSKDVESSSSDDDDESEEEEEEEEEGNIQSANEDDVSLTEIMAKHQRDNAQKVTGKQKATDLKVMICCVCLGENSDEDDEIVECDGCCVTVHEGCYGITESHSTASTESSASTEPWFCDACKAGVKPSCELCPHSDGIFKETDAGRWVHIVCALYIPGVAFGDVDKLSPVTLFEMPYTKWGAKACCICEDERFARTGVTVSCDAGMCRNYFHVTCAQREGLLTEASPDEDIADPFYAYCKLHADKYSVKIKKRNWLAYQSYMKQHTEPHITDEKEKFRVERKLNRHKQKFTIAKNKRPHCWVPPEKLPRLLTSCPSAVRRMIRKAELLGINTQVQSVASHKESKKRWHLSPGMTVEYVGYYLDRNVKITNWKSHLTELLTQNGKLQDQERILRIQYDQLSADVKNLNENNQKLRQDCESLWKVLRGISGKKLPLPSLLKPKKPAKSPTKKEVPRSPPAVIHHCGICNKSHDQHLLAKCDSCKLFYHLGCLDPPLSRMPKKTKLQGWQCSECVKSSSDGSEGVVVDAGAPMRLRETIKAPAKFTPPHLYPDFKRKRERKVGGGVPKRQLKMKRKRKLSEEKAEDETEQQLPKRMKENDDDEDLEIIELKPASKPPDTASKSSTPTDKLSKPSTPTDKPAKPVGRPRAPRRVTPKKPRDVRTECAACNKPGENSNLVRCDDCRLCYHFHCLDPPLKKTPKQRGYGWYCTACDPSDSDSDKPMEVEDVSEDDDEVMIIDTQLSNKKDVKTSTMTKEDIKDSKNPEEKIIGKTSVKPDSKKSSKLENVIAAVKHLKGVSEKSGVEEDKSALLITDTPEVITIESSSKAEKGSHNLDDDVKLDKVIQDKAKTKKSPKPESKSPKGKTRSPKQKKSPTGTMKSPKQENKSPKVENKSPQVKEKSSPKGKSRSPKGDKKTPSSSSVESIHLISIDKGSASKDIKSISPSMDRKNISSPVFKDVSGCEDWDKEKASRTVSPKRKGSENAKCSSSPSDKKSPTQSASGCPDTKTSPDSKVGKGKLGRSPGKGSPGRGSPGRSMEKNSPEEKMKKTPPKKTQPRTKTPSPNKGESKSLSTTEKTSKKYTESPDTKQNETQLDSQLTKRIKEQKQKPENVNCKLVENKNGSQSEIIECDSKSESDGSVIKEVGNIDQKVQDMEKGQEIGCSK